MSSPSPNNPPRIAPAPGSAAPLEPQAALETAALELIRQQLGYKPVNSARMFNGEPPPRMGTVFLSVWSDGGRESRSQTCLDEYFQFAVTITVKFVLPFDRWVQHRDELELRANRIRALLHSDCDNNQVLRAANTLAQFDDFSDDYQLLHVGFRECLTFTHMDAVQEVGAAWFKSHVDKPEAGAAQTLRFGKVRRIQNLAYMA